MEARKKLFGSNQSGGSHRRRPLVGVEQPRPNSSKLHGMSNGDVQARCNRLQSQNEALRTQNLELARELNDAKSKLRNSRQKERELERNLIRRDRASRFETPTNYDAPASAARERPQLYAEQHSHGQQQMRKNNSEGSNRIREYQGLRIGKQGSSASVPDGRLRDELPELVKEHNIRKAEAQASRGIPEAARSCKRNTVGIYRVGKAAPLVERQNRRESVLPNTLVDLHPGGCEGGGSLPMGNAKLRSPVRTTERLLPTLAKPVSRLASSPAPAHGGVEDGEYLPEDGMFRMDPSDQVDDERSSASDLVEIPTTPTASRCATVYTSPLDSSTSWPCAASPCPASPTGGSLMSSPENRCGIFASERGCAAATSALGEGTTSATKALDPPRGASGLPRTDTPLVATPRSMPRNRPRRDVARPLSYQEPSLSTKMRRGHVMFPKKKLAIQDAEKSQLMRVEKENGERRNVEDQERV